MNEKGIALESEAGFRVLFEYATIGIIVVNSTGNIELVNPETSRLFGYGAAELVGQKLEILIPDSLRRKHVEHRDGYFEKPKDRPMGLGMVLYAKRKDGQVFPVEISLSRYPLGGETLAVAFITDITAKVKAEQKLIKLNEELEAKVRERTLELTESLEQQKVINELKSRFVSMASHEFRTPLSTILSSVELVDRYFDGNQVDKAKKHIERIKSSVKNLTFILNDFLSLDKLEQGKLVSENILFEMDVFVNEVLEELEGLLKEGQHIDFHMEGPNKINSDKKILRNILFNLLSNAIKYSGEGCAIIMKAVVNDNYLSIEIIDHGIGIPEEEQQHLFRKFFRAKNALNLQGTGLGLNIVLRYLELMNGKISLSSKIGVGTTVFLKVPCGL